MHYHEHVGGLEIVIVTAVMLFIGILMIVAVAVAVIGILRLVN